MAVDKTLEIFPGAEAHGHLPAKPKAKTQALDFNPVSGSSHLYQKVLFPVRKTQSSGRRLHPNPGSLLTKLRAVFPNISPEGVVGSPATLVSPQPFIQRLERRPAPILLIILPPLFYHRPKSFQQGGFESATVFFPRKGPLNPVANRTLRHSELARDLRVRVFHVLHLHDKISLVR